VLVLVLGGRLATAQRACETGRISFSLIARRGQKPGSGVIMLARTCLALLVTAAIGTSISCKKKEDESLTLGEASQALEESKLSTQAEMLVGDSVEIATNFTIGDAVEAAAQELQAFIESQLPCAAITLEGATLTVEYGALPGECLYNGHSFSGTHVITVTRNGEGDVEVDHEWINLSNGIVEVSGTANVTWSLSQGSRHVVHELDWTRLSDDKSATGSGDRTQTVLSGGLWQGIEINGSRAWDGEAGHWDLDIDGVEVRWIDPVPQSGSYTLTTPADKTLAMTFERVDTNTIHVTITNGEKDFGFDVSTLPAG
jgi:hypothetical protein